MSAPKLPAATRPLDGTETFFLVQGGRPRKSTLGALSDFLAVEGPPGSDGKDGIVPIYGPDGTLWQGVVEREYEATVGSNGLWSIDYSAMGFTAVPVVLPIAWYTSNSAADQAISTGTIKTKTSASGRVISGVAASLAGLSSTWKFAPAGTIVTITVRGPTK